MRTLTVEDDFTNRLSSLQSLLAPYGECHIAVNGKEAVEAFRLAQATDRNYDLICMDITMLEMDGHQAVEEIRQLERSAGMNPSVTIVMTTSSNEAGRCQPGLSMKTATPIY